jgi:hypothetical protein
MNKRESIAHIIARRQPFVTAAIRTEKVIDELLARFLHLEKLREKICQQLPDRQARTNLEKFSFDQQAVSARELQNEVRQMAKRFNRNRLQIGVLGRARQGKSTKLQCLTGLSSNVIPAGNSSHCTGARSIIINDPEARPLTG